MHAQVDPSALAAELRASRAHLARMTAGLDGEKLLGPKLTIVNPPLWEIGHVGWFQEFWCLRNSARGTPPEPLVRGADALYNSAKVPHDTRWDLPLPNLKATLSYLDSVLERVLARIEREPENSELAYFVLLSIYHEDMHSEAFHYTRQTLGYRDPLNPAAASKADAEPRATDIEFAGGKFFLGARETDGFAFDNEKWAHEVDIRPFRLSRTAVTNAEFSVFVDDGGYARREWWSDEGWDWRGSAGLAAPKYWVQQGNAWHQRRFEQVVPLRPSEPVLHVNWHEANAYCRFAGRRLPTETEWEYAASWDPIAREKRRYPWGSAPPATTLANLETAGLASVESFAAGDSASGCRQLMGNVWEWTSTTFGPYPGFVVDPYKEYSEPWFGTHKVLRGGSFATTRRLIRNTWRNFYTPDRNDVFAGFRTCAMDR